MVDLYVGEKRFNIGDSVLEKYPNSKLGHAIREKKILHFDRDADIFRLIFDFIRYDSVSLKANDHLRGRMFIKDIEFYEIIPTGPVYLYDDASKFVSKFTWEEFKAKYHVE